MKRAPPPLAAGLAQGSDKRRQGVKGADQVGIQAIVEVGFAHAVQGAQADIADAVGKRGRQQVLRPGKLQDFPGARWRRAIRLHLQVLLPEGILETAGIATDDDQLPPFVSQARHEGTPHPASRTGDQRNLVHALSSMQRRNIPIVGQQLLTWTKCTTPRAV
jgi:hypothetical protein